MCGGLLREKDEVLLWREPPLWIGEVQACQTGLCALRIRPWRMRLRYVTNLSCASTKTPMCGSKADEIVFGSREDAADVFFKTSSTC